MFYSISNIYFICSHNTKTKWINNIFINIIKFNIDSDNNIYNKKYGREKKDK